MYPHISAYEIAVNSTHPECDRPVGFKLGPTQRPAYGADAAIASLV